MTNFGTFSINRQSFSTQVNPIQSKNSSFTIKSVPRPYQVTYDETPDPANAVNQTLEGHPNYLLFIDAKVYELYGSSIKHPQAKILKAPATEEFKTIQGMLQLVEFMTRHQITKGEKVIVVGGGIIQDIAGFACAIYRRGIPWTFFPTTLLSQCDSCIGGKTGLNHEGAKNQLALFSAPTEVVINPHFLKTLKRSEILSGLGEILKLHITGGRHFLNHYLANYPQNGNLDDTSAKALILGALAVKKVIIEADEFELDLRRSMNYGHTFGHAIEVLTDYRIPHGQAVAIGILLANELSFNRGLLSQKDRDELKSLTLQLLDPEPLSIMKGLQVKGLFDLLKKDKKTMGSQVNFIVVHRVGDMQVLPIQLDENLVSEVTETIKKVFT